MSELWSAGDRWSYININITCLWCPSLALSHQNWSSITSHHNCYKRIICLSCESLTILPTVWTGSNTILYAANLSLFSSIFFPSWFAAPVLFKAMIISVGEERCVLCAWEKLQSRFISLLFSWWIGQLHKHFKLKGEEKCPRRSDKI